MAAASSAACRSVHGICEDLLSYGLHGHVARKALGSRLKYVGSFRSSLIQSACLELSGISERGILQRLTP